jgi:hypothetical protein
MTKLFGLVILTQKEVIQLAKEERGLGYGAGLKSKWRAKKKKPEIFIDEAQSITDKQMEILKAKYPLAFYGSLTNAPPPETSAQTTDENGMPTVYGDSLPLKGETAGVTADPDLTLTSEG